MPKAPDSISDRKRREIYNTDPSKEAIADLKKKVAEYAENLAKYPQWGDDPLDSSSIEEWPETYLSTGLRRFDYFFQHIVVDWDLTETSHFTILKDLFKTLKISKEASQAQISEAYRTFLHDTEERDTLSRDEREQKSALRKKLLPAWQIMLIPLLRQRHCASTVNRMEWDNIKKFQVVDNPFKLGKNHKIPVECALITRETAKQWRTVFRDEEALGFQTVQRSIETTSAPDAVLKRPILSLPVVKSGAPEAKRPAPPSVPVPASSTAEAQPLPARPKPAEAPEAKRPAPPSVPVPASSTAEAQPLPVRPKPVDIKVETHGADAPEARRPTPISVPATYVVVRSQPGSIHQEVPPIVPEDELLEITPDDENHPEVVETMKVVSPPKLIIFEGPEKKGLLKHLRDFSRRRGFKAVPTVPPVPRVSWDSDDQGKNLVPLPELTTFDESEEETEGSHSFHFLRTAVSSSFGLLRQHKILSTVAFVAAAGTGWYVFSPSRADHAEETQSNAFTDKVKRLTNDVNPRLAAIARVDTEYEKILHGNWDNAVKSGEESQLDGAKEAIDLHYGLLPTAQGVVQALAVLRENDHKNDADKTAESRETGWKAIWDAKTPDIVAAQKFLDDLYADPSFKKAQTEDNTPQKDEVADQVQKWDTALKSAFALLDPARTAEVNSFRFQWSDNKNEDTYDSIMATCAIDYFNDNNAQVQKWLDKLKDLPEYSGKNYPNQWAASAQGGIVKENEVLKEIQKAYDAALATPAPATTPAKPEPAKAAPETTPPPPHSQTEFVIPPSTADSKTPSFTRWHPVRSDACANEWHDDWTSAGYVAVLMVVCEDGQIKDDHCVFSKEGEKAITIRGGETKKPMKIKPYDFPVDSYSTVCSVHKNDTDKVFRMEILGK